MLLSFLAVGHRSFVRHRNFGVQDREKHVKEGLCRKLTKQCIMHYGFEATMSGETTERCFQNSDGPITDDLMPRKSTIITGCSATCT